MPSINPNLWFDGNAQQAAEFYCSIFPNSRIVSISKYPEGTGAAGSVMVVDWELDGKRFTGINGGPQFTFDEAVSFLIECEDQAEVDYYWQHLLADGGQESECGWLKDKYGLSWQVVPKGAEALFRDPDTSRAARAMQAMFQMKKLDLAALQAAADAEPAHA